MISPILCSPVDLKQVPAERLPDVAASIREFLIDTISRTGGHIGANLGVVELSIAVHRVFDSPTDKIIWDTGHQGYTHKIITGRGGMFSTLNTFGGMSRFLTRQESEHDIIDATHAGTSISIASGIAWGLRASGSPGYTVAVIGDGSMVEGLAFEALNFVAGSGLNLMVVLNDNGMAIAPNVGGMKNLTGGDGWETRSRAFFEGLGFKYAAVPDGHDVQRLVTVLGQARTWTGPVVVHVKTEKGRGLPYARTHPYKMHFSMPFDPGTGAGASPTVAGRTYAVVAAEELTRCLRVDSDVCVITPATPYASSLEPLLVEFPGRVFDVGMAEQHAACMACGLALAGRKPVVCFQTTFMQRAFDQLLHDACYMNLPVTFLGVRSGFSGYDGPTHHGLYDIPYLRSFPNMQVEYPFDSQDLREMISRRLELPSGPMVVLYPYEPIPQPEPAVGVRDRSGISVVAEGRDGIILCLGNRLAAAHQLRQMLVQAHAADFGLACVRAIKPLPRDRIAELCRSAERVVTLEEGTLPGGFGSLICETVADAGINASVLRSGVADRFVPAGTKEECSAECGLEPREVLRQVVLRWPDLAGRSEVS